MEETANARYQIGVDINSNKCEKEKVRTFKYTSKMAISKYLLNLFYTP